jgi:hypothetical protein
MALTAPMINRANYVQKSNFGLVDQPRVRHRDPALVSSQCQRDRRSQHSHGFCSHSLRSREHNPAEPKHATFAQLSYRLDWTNLV